MREQIQRKTEGNPFFIEEVVRALIADGTLVERHARRRLAARAADRRDLRIPDTCRASSWRASTASRRASRAC